MPLYEFIAAQADAINEEIGVAISTRRRANESGIETMRRVHAYLSVIEAMDEDERAVRELAAKERT